MTRLAIQAATTAWDPLRRELDSWANAGKVATLWWRDDDAVRASPSLERLLALAGDVPLALAVIPAQTEPFSANVTVLQHGWSHANEAPAGARKSELAHESVLDRLAAGKARLEALFGVRFLPVMVPPWNRITVEVVRRLPELGYIGLSVLGPRRSNFERNVHVDLINWRTRRFAGVGQVIGQLTSHLAARRNGAVADEPTGMMTHHLVQDAMCEAFIFRLLEITRAHPAACWLAPREVFGAA